MDKIKTLPIEILGKNFIPAEYLPEGKDEFYQRNNQTCWPNTKWRQLRYDEIEKLINNNNTSTNWNDIFVSDEFDTDQIKNNEFFGHVRIGNVKKNILEYHDLKVPVGITNSLIISCDIGDYCAIHNVHYLSHYIIGDGCILLNIDEMQTTNYAKFGNGIIKEGEAENLRIWLDIMNETGSRKIIPFDGMITADAYLWAKYRDDKIMLERLKEITQNTFDNRRGLYGTIGECCVIKHSRIIKDVKIGSNCYIKGANKLKNLTINSSESEPSQIGEGVELVNGIIGYGCHIFYGVKAVRFILGNNSNLKYGARLIHSFLGDNSTISCCEVLNNLIFPAHEQHHNNSFLIASVVKGQSNIAAGATIGSNHNSRANDNEIEAGRGFWPGLCTSVKHSSRFASFVLLSKSDYPAELNIPFPFSLINNNYAKDELEIMPAFWWLYNMYALARNTWKFKDRDKRKNKIQKIEFESLAPDTIEEIFNARKLLEIYTAKAYLKLKNEYDTSISENELVKIGKELLSEPKEKIKGLQVFGENIEKSNRKIRILKFYEAYHAYADMIHYYAIKNILEYIKANNASFEKIFTELKSERYKKWINLGGQLIKESDVDDLRNKIRTGKLNSWNEIHKQYEILWEKYIIDKQKHAFASICDLYDIKDFSEDKWIEILNKSIKIQQYICDKVYDSRKKDYENPFRQITYRNTEEMDAALGNIDDNPFIKQVRQETEDFISQINELKNKIK
jgi:hypothetical protein